MNHERSLIDLINSVMPVSPLRKSRSGEADAELILLGDKEYLFTTDDFSSEDLFWEGDPFDLGWNLACGAISDIIASGGQPLVYAHAMVVPPAWDGPYIREFSRGISAVLQEYGVSFIGGDTGRAEKWRYTASVIGFPVGKALGRRACRAGDAIFVTGQIGAGNLMAALSLYAGDHNLDTLPRAGGTRFSTHTKLPGIISKYASSAIDTSDGVFAALQTLADLNGTGFKIGDLPFLSRGLLASRLLELPPLLLLLGECGEYEILFTVSQGHKELLKDELNRQDIEAHELGEITSNAGQKTVLHENRPYDLESYSLKARDFDRVEDYLKAMAGWLQRRGELS
jgi:thiamine-monophosphate kinase